MNLETLISSNAVICNQNIKSKKRALEILAEHLATETSDSNRQPSEEQGDNPDIDSLTIFQLLTDREKLGSTSLGSGVALPHARSELTEKAIGAFMKLDDGIDFDSPDDQKTDLIFALLVPEHSTDEHLQILSHLATLFSDEGFCKTIRQSSSQTEIYHHLINWQVTSQAS
jgi:PTS system nitrogen regulatory IIA component